MSMLQPNTSQGFHFCVCNIHELRPTHTCAALNACAHYLGTKDVHVAVQLVVKGLHIPSSDCLQQAHTSTRRSLFCDASSLPSASLTLEWKYAAAGSLPVCGAKYVGVYVDMHGGVYHLNLLAACLCM